MANNQYTVTKITDEKEYYVYPMAASLRGGATESEYNIRNLMSLLFSSSSAKTSEDFRLLDVSNDYAVIENLDSDNYTINAQGTEITLKNLALSTGAGNCTGYLLQLEKIQAIKESVIELNPDTWVEVLDGSYCKLTDSSAPIFELNKFFEFHSENNTYSLLPAQPDDWTTQWTKYYKKASNSYSQDIYIVLGLDYATNSLVSACKISLFSKAEYELDLARAKAANLLDNGIFIGKLRVLKDQVAPGIYSYSVNFIENVDKTVCVDITKIGSGGKGLDIYLYNMLRRLYTLMLDSGSFILGVPFEPFSENPADDNHDFNLVSKYRIELGLDSLPVDFTNASNNEYPDKAIADGYIRVITYDESSQIATPFADIIKFTLNLQRDGNNYAPESIANIEIFGDAIRILQSEVELNRALVIRNSKEIFKADAATSIYATGNYLDENGVLHIGNDPALTETISENVTGSDAEYTLSIGPIISNSLVITDTANNKIYKADNAINDIVNIYLYENDTFIDPPVATLNTTSKTIQFNSSIVVVSPTILCTYKVQSTKITNISFSNQELTDIQELHAGKVYGAVWM